VEEQIAIIYCGVKGLLLKVPIARIKNFEMDFLNKLREEHADLLQVLKSGKIGDDETATLEAVCKQVAPKYEL
jgi:F-type H+-transporting ATPase subunit alpha